MYYVAPYISPEIDDIIWLPNEFDKKLIREMFWENKIPPKQIALSLRLKEVVVRCVLKQKRRD